MVTAFQRNSHQRYILHLTSPKGTTILCSSFLHFLPSQIIIPVFTILSNNLDIFAQMARKSWNLLYHCLTMTSGILGYLIPYHSLQPLFNPFEKHTLLKTYTVSFITQQCFIIFFLEYHTSRQKSILDCPSLDYLLLDGLMLQRLGWLLLLMMVCKLWNTYKNEIPKLNSKKLLNACVNSDYPGDFAQEISHPSSNLTKE